jgi:hypothetical protein
MARKRGRPPNPDRARIRSAVPPGWSDRTFARFWWAVIWLKRIEGQEGLEAAMRRSRWKNGHTNVSKLRREAIRAIMAARDRLKAR